MIRCQSIRKHLPLAVFSLLLIGLFLLRFDLATAQSANATLSGSVEDQNGAVVPGASITVENIGTGLKRQTTTSTEGNFTVPLLPPGTYTVRAQREGFSPVQVSSVVLNVGDQKALQIQLKAGNISEMVQIVNEAPLIDTSPAVGTVIDRQFVENLPLNGRSFQSLILLTPGVVVAGGLGRPGQFSVNGQRSNANYFTVDGVTANNGADASLDAFAIGQAAAGVLPGVTTFGGTNSLVSVDALEEFKIQTSTYAAEFGRQPGGQVSLVTRGGTNQFHGTVFDYLRNEVFDANDWFANAGGRKRAPLRQNQFGGTFSGPVLLPRFGEGGRQPGYNGRNRTFFFLSYEGLRLLLPKAEVAAVPSLRLRAEAAPALRPLLAAFPLPEGPELLNASGQPTGFSPITGVYSDPSTLNATSIRIDHTVNERLTLFGRFNDAPSNTTTRIPSILSQVREIESTSRGLTLGATAAVTPKLSNELRFNFSTARGTGINKLDDFGGAVPVGLSAMVTDLNSKGTNVRGIFSYSSPSGGVGFLLGPDRGLTQRQINLVDNVSWVKGGHQLKFGIDYRRLAPTYDVIDYNHNTLFSGEAQLRSSTAGLLLINTTQETRPRLTNISVYGQDRWRLSRRLTVDLGLRWDINPVPGEASGKRLVGVIGLDNLATATLAPPDAPVYKTDYQAFAPRIGVAYQLSETKGWERLVRGGFGVYYDLGNGGNAAAAFLGFPFVASSTQVNVPFPIPPALAEPPPFPVVRFPIPGGLTVLDPELRLPYTLQWNVSVEQSLGPSQTVSASYVAAAGRRLIMQQLINQAVAGRRPNPNFGVIRLLSAGPTSDYHSLQLQYQRRLSRSIQALMNYTWSHAIDEVSDQFTFGVLERGNADFDVRHNLSSAITYNLPGRGVGGVVGRVIGNWSLDGIVHAQSAAPINLRVTSFVREDGTQTDVRPDLIVGQPLYLADPGVAGGRRINSGAFRVPSAGRQGTLGRNVLKGLPLSQVDLALRRMFSLTERLNLQVKAEAFNVFNHPNFGGLGNNVSTPSTLGVPTQMLGRSLGGLSPLYQIGGPRSLQFSLRLSF